MTAAVAIQSVPSKAVQSVESNVKSTPMKNKDETSALETERKSSFKNLYDDAKKVDGHEEGGVAKHEVNNAGGNKERAEDGKNLPSNDTLTAEKESDVSVNQKTMGLEEEAGQDFFTAQQASILNVEKFPVTTDGLAGDMVSSLKTQAALTAIAKQQGDNAEINNLSASAGLSGLEQSKLNIAIENQGLKTSANHQSLNEKLAIAPGSRSLAQRLSLAKAGDGLVNSAGKNIGSSEGLSLSPAQMTDDLLMGDMDKAFNKVLMSDKPSLDAMLGKLEGLANTTVSGQKTSAVIPLSTALNYASAPLVQEFSSVSQTTITEALGKPEWNQSMSKQISWMASQNIRSAEIKLSPANLGTIEVRVDMNEDKLNVTFSSRDAGVRDMVEQTMPKLREMMEEQGLELGDTDVSEQTFLEQQEEGFMQQENLARAINGEAGLSAADSESADGKIVQAVSTSMSAVDYYI